MRRARAFARPPIARQLQSFPVPTVPPVGGWNTRDALAAMPPEDAVVLDNLFPGLGSVKSRAGCEAYATTLGGSVKTLAEFNAGSLRKFIAAANGNLWNISAAGAGVSLASGFGSDIWDAAQFDDAGGGARMGLVNGTDAPQTYNGAAVAAMVISGVGLTPANLNGIHIFKGRSYFFDDRTQDFWYSATNALGGVCTKFPLGRVQSTGGNLLAMATWSRDAGDGMDDLAVFVLSSGDVLIYAGDDPGTAASWNLVGVYNIAPPVSKRGIEKIGADLIIATKAGYISLASVFQGGRFNEESSSISSKIRQAVLDAMNSFSSLFGWEIKLYPRGNYALVNVPTSTTAFNQHIINVETKAWCRFTGQAAQCWGLFNDALYYGKADGTVVKADTGTSDLGVAITSSGQTAWNFLGDPRNKQILALRFGLKREASSLGYTAGIAFDYKQLLTTLNQSVSDSAGATWLSWETNPWDTQPWGSALYLTNQWCSSGGMGYAVSVSLQFSVSTQRVEWLSTSYLVKPGAPV